VLLAPTRAAGKVDIQSQNQTRVLPFLAHAAAQGILKQQQAGKIGQAESGDPKVGRLAVHTFHRKNYSMANVNDG
jgi:hypothetical protein